MKRTKRTLIALVVVAVVLVAAVLVLVLPDQVSGGEEAASSSSTGSTLYEYASEDLESLAVTNENGTFTIVPDAEATAEAQEKADEAAASAGSSTAASTVTTEFMVEELSGLPQNQTAVNLAAKDGYVFATVKTVTETDDLASYGLSADDPAATLTATFTDGTVKTLYVGTQTPLDSSSRYVREDGSNVVYAANVTETLLGPVTGFVDTGITDYTASEDDNAEGVSAASSPFVKIDIQNQNGTLSLSRSGESQPWSVNGLPASGDAVSTLSASLASMTAQDVVQIDPSDEDLSTYGLSDPAARVSMTTTGGETTTLLIGGTNEDGQYYARLDGGRLVYTLSSSGTSWLSDDEMSLRCLTFLNDDVSAVQSFKMTGGASYDFEVTRTEEASSSTEDQTSYSYSVTLNGTELSDYLNFTTFYDTAQDLQILEDAGDAAPSGTPAWTITLTGYDASLSHTYQFYASGDRRYLVVVDGTVFGLMNTADFTALTDAAAALAE